MDNKMFCFQCEQAAHCTGCTDSAGVCGKSAETANLQDELTGALIGLARATDGNEKVILLVAEFLSVDVFHLRDVGVDLFHDLRIDGLAVL